MTADDKRSRSTTTPADVPDGPDPEGQFKNLLEASPQPFMTHVDGEIVYANQAAAELFGCELAELIGMSVWEFVVPGEIPRLRAFAERRLTGAETPERYQFIGHRLDATPLDLEFSVRLGKWNGATAFQVFASDRTAEQHAIRRLTESERKFRDLVEGSIQGLLVHKDWRIVYANAAAAGLFGYSLEEFTDLDVRDLVSTDDRELIEELRRKRLAGETDIPDRYDLRGRTKAGKDIVVEIFSRRVEWDGEPAVQSTMIDVTQRLEIERHLLDAKEAAEHADRAKTEFLGNMSHELRTPLNAIIGFSQMIRDEMLGSTIPQYIEYAGAIHTSGVHLLDVVSDLLDVSSIEAGSLVLNEEIVDACELIRASERMLRTRAQKADLVIALDAPGEPVWLKGDERRLKQILINLVGNAVKFTNPEGQIFVSLKRNEDKTTVISVRDTGIGIEPAHLKRIFEPFYRVDTFYVSQREGTGLGLPLVKSLADLHGADILIESVYGEGTTVTLRFPESRSANRPN